MQTQQSAFEYERKRQWLVWAFRFLPRGSALAASFDLKISSQMVSDLLHRRHIHPERLDALEKWVRRQQKRGVQIPEMSQEHYDTKALAEVLDYQRRLSELQALLSRLASVLSGIASRAHEDTGIPLARVSEILGGKTMDPARLGRLERWAADKAEHYLKE